MKIGMHMNFCGEGFGAILFGTTRHQVALLYINFYTVQSIAKLPTWSSKRMSTWLYGQCYPMFPLILHYDASDGRSPVPKVTTAVCTFALFTGNGFSKEFGGCLRSTDSMAGEAVSLHSLLANRNCKIYRQNFEADDFPCGAVNLFKGGRANSRGFYSFIVCQKNPPQPGSALATRSQPPPSLSPSFKN
ncbi:hypothetical protein TNCV_4760711 [Trichonephila clavipes]|uniref:Uncharacterized protein n=1 Tax=Trichonephila clavipes TaxID=2585209 RepID=A0A8X6RQ82_TRICX|nr:hypothetical protein TNCV_4760711 [Trichonephila clavipes]